MFKSPVCRAGAAGFVFASTAGSYYDKDLLVLAEEISANIQKHNDFVHDAEGGATTDVGTPSSLTESMPSPVSRVQDDIPQKSDTDRDAVLSLAEFESSSAYGEKATSEAEVGGCEGNLKTAEDLCEAAAKALEEGNLTFKGKAKLEEGLDGGCSALDAGSASRSNAIIALTRNKNFVIKMIKAPEVVELEKLTLPDSESTLLSPTWLLDRARCVVAMPNLEQAIRKVVPADAEVKKFDVKPKPAKSAERPAFFQHLLHHAWSPARNATKLLRCNGTGEFDCWKNLEQSLNASLDFLRKGNLVDYSLLFTFAFVKEAEILKDAVIPSNCILSMHPGFREQVGVLCLNIIDYLMHLDSLRKLESYFKDGKWDNYDIKMDTLFDCVGSVHRTGECAHYVDEGLAVIFDSRKCEVKEDWRCKVVDADLDWGCRKPIGCDWLSGKKWSTCIADRDSNGGSFVGKVGSRYVTSWEACCCKQFV